MSEQLATPIAGAVERLARAIAAAPDAAMDSAWAWDDYDSEGVRFAAFVAYTELCDLGVRAGAARTAAGRQPSVAQRILGQYHIGWRELEALLLTIDDAQADRIATEDSWSVRQVLAHIVDADTSFYAITRYGYEHGQQGAPVEKAPNEYYDQLLGSDEDFKKVMESPTSTLWAFYVQHHARVLSDLGVIGDDLSDVDVRYWENKPYPIRFRLHRFDAHLRQHAIQIEKTLIALGRPLSEAQRLVRLLYRALGELEATLLGAPDLLADAQASTAAAINNRTGEVALLLA